MKRMTKAQIKTAAKVYAYSMVWHALGSMTDKFTEDEQKVLYEVQDMAERRLRMMNKGTAGSIQEAIKLVI